MNWYIVLCMEKVHVFYYNIKFIIGNTYILLSEIYDLSKRTEDEKDENVAT